MTFTRRLARDNVGHTAACDAICSQALSRCVSALRSPALRECILSEKSKDSLPCQTPRVHERRGVHSVSAFLPLLHSNAIAGRVLNPMGGKLARYLSPPPE